MSGKRGVGEVLVSGYAVASGMIGSVLPELPGEVRMKEAHWIEPLVRQLRRGEHPLCVMEEYVSIRNPVPAIRRLLGRGPNPNLRNLGYVELTCAVNILPDLVEASPETRFVIACHSRCGVTKKDRDAFERRPEVLKVIGFVNSKRNSQFLVKTMRGIYFE